MTSSYERELVNRLRELGWYAQRAGSSGSATNAALPDVLAAKEFADGTFAGWAIEHKTADKDRLVYVTAEKAEQLEEINDRTGFTPKVGLRWKGDTNVYLRTPDEDCYRTDEGNLRFRAEQRSDWPGEILRKPRDGGLTNTALPTPVR